MLLKDRLQSRLQGRLQSRLQNRHQSRKTSRLQKGGLIIVTGLRGREGTVCVVVWGGARSARIKNANQISTWRELTVPWESAEQRCRNFNAYLSPRAG
jgi:hypothetical protein